MLRNSTILITGGGSGIGEALAVQLADNNEIVICGRHENKLERVASRHRNISYQVTDLSDYTSIENLFSSQKKKGIVFNVLFNNAGVVEVWDVNHSTLTSKDIFEKVSTNLSGAIAVTQHFILQANTADQNLIINNTSEIVIMPIPLMPLYSASKSGLSVFTRSLRVQLKNTNFKVIELLPPGVDTDMPKQLNVKEKFISADKFAEDIIRNIRKGKIEYAPGKNAFLLKAMGKFLPNCGLSIIDKLSRKQLGFH